MSKTVKVTYDSNSLQTTITVDGKPFDTSRIDGKEIADWVYPFMMRKVRWNGIFEELAKVVGSDEYTIQFSGSNAAMLELMEECPESVVLKKAKTKANAKAAQQNTEANAAQQSVENYEEILDELVKILNNENASENEKANAFAQVQKLAEQGYALSQITLGAIYRYGYYGIDADEDLADKWYKLAAIQGEAEYQFKYAEFLSENNRDYEAAQWYEKAVTQGHADSMFRLGNLYRWGYGVEEDKFKAVELYQNAIENNCWEAEMALGTCYYNGEGVRKNYVNAIECFEAFIKKSNDSRSKGICRVCLGNIYMSGGYGVHQSYKKAFDNYRRGADSGNTTALVRVGWMYAEGYYLEQNDYKSSSCFRKAAAYGNDEAKYLFGINLLNGVGRPKDIEKGLMYIFEAADEGVETAQEFLDENDISY